MVNNNKINKQINKNYTKTIPNYCKIKNKKKFCQNDLLTVHYPIYHANPKKKGP